MTDRTFFRSESLCIFICAIGIVAGFVFAGAIHDAAVKGDVNRVKALIEAGGDFEAADHHGDTPLWLAMDSNQAEVAMFLLESGASYTGGRFDKYPLLHSAAAKGYDEIVQWLLKKGVAPDLRDASKMTALHWAVRNKQTGTATLLLDAGADVNAEDASECTALVYAIQSQDREMAEMLIERGDGRDMGQKS